MGDAPIIPPRTRSFDLPELMAELRKLEPVSKVVAAERLDQVGTDRSHAADLLLRALIEVGEAERMKGRFAQATGRFERALEIARHTGDTAAEWHTLAALGFICRVGRRYEKATEYYGSALDVARAVGDRTGEAHALRSLGHLHRLQGRYDRAVEVYGPALDLARSIGDPIAEHNTLYGLGLVDLAKGRPEQALGHFEQAVAVAPPAVSSHSTPFESLDGMGRAYTAMGRYADARAWHHRGLSLATELGHPTNQVRAHDGLAHAHHGEGAPERARRHWQAALDIFAAHGIDHTYDPRVTADAIRTHLAALDGHRDMGEGDNANRETHRLRAGDPHP
jgi:tetratricopeptide (TPR) repeat protein